MLGSNVKRLFDGFYNGRKSVDIVNDAITRGENVQ